MRDHTCAAFYVGGLRAGRPCPYRASAIVDAGAQPFRVCGYHARAYQPGVVYGLDWSMARIRRWQMDNIAAVEGERP